MICNEPCGSAQLCCFPFETSRFFLASKRRRPGSAQSDLPWGLGPSDLAVFPFKQLQETQIFIHVHHEPPRTHGKIEVFGHLKTRLFTIKTSKHVGNTGLMVSIHIPPCEKDEHLQQKYIEWGYVGSKQGNQK